MLDIQALPSLEVRVGVDQKPLYTRSQAASAGRGCCGRDRVRERSPPHPVVPAARAAPRPARNHQSRHRPPTHLATPKQRFDSQLLHAFDLFKSSGDGANPAPLLADTLDAADGDAALQQMVSARRLGSAGGGAAFQQASDAASLVSGWFDRSRRV
jgi:hypothetical protein